MPCGNESMRDAAQALALKSGLEYLEALTWVKGVRSEIYKAITTDGVIDWDSYSDVAIKLWEADNG